MTWPDGTRTTIADPPTDQRGTLRYGDPEPTWERFATLMADEGKAVKKN